MKMARLQESGYVREINENGFAIVPDVIDSQMIRRLRNSLDSISSIDKLGQRQTRSGGVRDLLNVAPDLRELQTHRCMRALIDPIEGRAAQVVRSIFFDKSPQANWKVAWHQDVTIAVREKIELSGFAAWSVKASTPHVHPPVWVLEHILTVRLHLDAAEEPNGALRVIPRSHRHGRLSSEKIRMLTERTAGVICAVPEGGAIVMRPLLVHSSSAGASPSRRRVIHLEFSALQLPGGLDWYPS